MKLAKKVLGAAVMLAASGGLLAQSATVGIDFLPDGVSMDPIDLSTNTAVAGYTGQRSLASEILGAAVLEVDLSGFTIGGNAPQGANGVSLGEGDPAAGVNIFYNSGGLALNSTNIITFGFTGATYESTTVFLLVEESAQPGLSVSIDTDGDPMTPPETFFNAFDFNNDDDVDDVLVLATVFGALPATDSLTAPSGNGVPEVSLSVTSGLIIPAGITAFLSTADTCASTAGVCDDRTSVSPAIEFQTVSPSGFASFGISTTVQVESGTVIPAGSASNVLFDSRPQFELDLDAEASTINVAAAPLPPLTAFLGEAGGMIGLANTTTGPAAFQGAVIGGSSNAELTAENNTAIAQAFPGAPAGIFNFVEFDLEFIAGDVIDLTLTGDTSALEPEIGTTLDFQFINANGAFIDLEIGDGELVIEGTAGSTPAGNIFFNGEGAASVSAITLIVDGSTVVAERVIDGEVTLTLTEPNTTANVTVSDAEPTHVWTNNATVLEATFVNLNPNFLNRFVCSNTGSVPANFFFTGQGSVAGAFELDPATANGVIPPGTTLSVNAQDLLLGDVAEEATNQATFQIVLEAAANVVSCVTQVIQPGVGALTSQEMVALDEDDG